MNGATEELKTQVAECQGSVEVTRHNGANNVKSKTAKLTCDISTLQITFCQPNYHDNYGNWTSHLNEVT